MSTFFAPEDDAYFSVIENGMAGHKRSQQRMIGPSGIGDPCDISLTYAVAKHRAPRHAFSGWKPTIGTATHAWLEQTFEAENERLGHRRWVTEQRLYVGKIGGEDVWGSSDLYDLYTRTVMDHKVVGPTMLKKYKSNGPSEQYQAQAHLYGLGFLHEAKAFGRPREVAICFLPRDGELSSSWVWRQDFDQDIALEALARANRLHRNLMSKFGGDPVAATQGMSPCSEPFCDYCSARRYNGTMFG